MKLFEQFPPISTQEWMDRLRADLKGADFEKAMVWRPVEGFEVMPFYRREDIDNLQFIGAMPGEYPFLRGSGKTDNSWYIRQNIVVINAAEANSKAVNILGRGVDSICFDFSPGIKPDRNLIDVLLKGIFIEAIELNFSPHGSARELLDALTGSIQARGIRPSMLKGAIETDPLGRLMVNGKLCVTVGEGLDYLADLARAATGFPHFRVLRVNGSVFGNAGSTTVQELALTLAMGSEYMHQLTSRGISADDAASSMGFTFGIGSGYFMEIAKLRAARMLWASIVKRYNPSSDDAMKMNIHSVTTDWNKTVYDPYVNMLRSQTEAMSAIIGGADSLTVNPFDSTFAAPAEFSERIARNQQLLLKEESHLDKIVDPSSGSYYIENLTASMAGSAWSVFIEIEEQGGFIEALRKGYIQSLVEETKSKRKIDVARGREKLLGTNIFPDFKERLPGYLAEKRNKPESASENLVKPLVKERAAEEFEKIRNSTDRSGRRPKVFMLTIGNVAKRKARSQFSSNFFAVAGYEVIDNTGFVTAGDGVNEAVKAKADIVVLCSSDEEYEVFGPEVKSLLKSRAILVIAGAPASTEILREKGIEHFINERSNLPDTLRLFNKLLQIGQ